jgi:hypothetical protein
MADICLMTRVATALKEWAVVIEALLTGDTVLLMRKGGIREGSFTMAGDRVLLYPTYEHQRSHLLRSEAITIPQELSPGQVTLAAWANITDVLQVSEAEQLQALMPQHIWTEQFASERLKWKPKQPLSVLLLRTYALTQPVKIPEREQYGGCRSWIELESAMEIDEARPVLTQKEYVLRSQLIIEAIQTP